MLSLLFIGFLIGMRHALEADHVAAVASLATTSHSLGDAIKQGAVWGLGHTITLFLFGSIVILSDSIIPDRIATGLEFAVGAMLVVLGIDVMRRLRRDKVHFHSHRHDNGIKHFHAHKHTDETHHTPGNHHHKHSKLFPRRALFIGFMHGMAGSATLIMLTLQTVNSLATGLLYSYL